MAEKKYFASGRYIILKSDIDFYVRLYGKDNESGNIYLHPGTHEISNKGNEILNLIVSDESVKVGFSNQLFFLNDSGQSLNNDNLLINGSFRVAQDGTTFDSTTVPLNNDDTYLLDQWVLLSNGNNIVSVNQLLTGTMPPGIMSFCRFTVVTANQKFGFFQPIENKNCAYLTGEKISLSFYARSPVLNPIVNCRVAVVSWAGAADAITSDIVSAWNVSGVNPSLVANWTYAASSENLNLENDWQYFTLNNITVPAGATNIGVFIWSDDTSTTIGDIMEIAGVNLIRGEAAKKFVYRSYEIELSLCERYFFKYAGTDGNSPIMDFGQVVSATLASILISHPEEMRQRPLGYYSADADFAITDAVAGALTPTAMVVAWAFNSTRYNNLTFVVVAAGLVPGDITYLYMVSNTAYLKLDARL